MYAPWVSTFLARLAVTGNISRSARDAGVSSSAPYGLRKTDADFDAAFCQAQEDFTDACEEELTRRAFGYEEPVVYQGQLTPVYERDAAGQIVVEAYEEGGELKHRPVQARDASGNLVWLTVRKFSDTLLLARVKAYRKRYATDRTELTGADGGPMQMSDTERAAKIAAILAKAQARKDEKDFSDLA